MIDDQQVRYKIIILFRLADRLPFLFPVLCGLPWWLPSACSPRTLRCLPKKTTPWSGARWPFTPNKATGDACCNPCPCGRSAGCWRCCLPCSIRRWPICQPQRLSLSRCAPCAWGAIRFCGCACCTPYAMRVSICFLPGATPRANPLAWRCSPISR